MAKHNHPNRFGNSRGRNPTPADVRAARETAKLSPEDAAARVYASPTSWRNWEADKTSPENRPMHAGLYELFLLKTAQLQLDEVLDRLGEP